MGNDFYPDDDGSDIVDISSEIKDSSSSRKSSEIYGDDGTVSVKTFRKKKGKWIKWVVIAAVILGIAGFIVYKVIQAKNMVMDAMNQSSTTTAEITRMDISKAISTTGTIQSKDVRTLTSPLSGVKIDHVNYKVGDMVEEGAVVVAFSFEDINKKIEQLQEDIDEANKTKALDAGNRDNTYVNKYDLETYSVATAYESFQRAAEDLKKAKDDYAKACQDTADYKAKYQEAKEKIDGVRNDYHDTIEERNSYINIDDEKYKEYDNKAADLQIKINGYTQTISGYDSGIDNYLKAEKTAQETVDKYQRNYDDAVVQYVKSGYDASFSTANTDYTYKKENITANDTVTNLKRQLEEREDSLDNYIVTAPISGLVTEVNAQEGNGYQATSGALMTIQAVDIYEVTTQVDEYDINNVKVGQKVAIMTDATGEDELEGRVTFIAPTATMAAGNSSTNTFEVKVDISGKDERLKLGMSARLNILVDTHSDVLAVPYDAIEEKDGGDTYIYVVEETASEPTESKDEDGIKVIGIEIPGETAKNFGKGGDDEAASVMPGDKQDAKEIKVQIGLESDYYTEVISPEISEGMTVLVNSKAGEIKNDLSMFMGM